MMSDSKKASQRRDAMMWNGGPSIPVSVWYDYI